MAFMQISFSYGKSYGYCLCEMLTCLSPFTLLLSLIQYLSINLLPFSTQVAILGGIFLQNKNMLLYL